MPELVDPDLRQLGRVRNITQTEGFRTSVREALGNGGDHVGLAKDVADGDEVRHPQADVPAYPGIVEYRVHPGWLADPIMKIRILGAGPAGLYFAALMKRLDSAHDIAIFERSARNATWGFGVVFSDRALEFLRADDEALYQYLTPHLENWPDITIVHNDTAIPVAGNGFASIGRLELLTLLYQYVERLGVNLHFDTEITTLKQMGEADLVVGANGAFSWIRSENEDSFGTTTDWRPNKFIWYGTTKAFDSLTLTFRETNLGVFCAHHYRYRPDRSTFLVEVENATWQRAGFAAMCQNDTIRHCERVFAKEPGRASDHLEQLAVARFPGDLERALEPRQCRAAGRRVADGALLDRLGHAPGNGGFGRAVQGLQGGRDEGCPGCAGAVPAAAHAANAEDLGSGERKPALVRGHGPSRPVARARGVCLQLHDPHGSRRSCGGQAPGSQAGGGL